MKFYLIEHISVKSAWSQIFPTTSLLQPDFKGHGCCFYPLCEMDRELGLTGSKSLACGNISFELSVGNYN